MGLRGVDFDARVTLEPAQEEALLKLLRSPTFCRQASEPINTLCAQHIASYSKLNNFIVVMLDTAVLGPGVSNTT